MAGIKFPEAVGDRLALLERIQSLRARGLDSLRQILESGGVPVSIKSGDTLGAGSSSLTTLCIVWGAHSREEIGATPPSPDFNKYEAQAAAGDLNLESETFGKNNVITTSFLLLAIVASRRARSKLADAAFDILTKWISAERDPQRPISAYPVFQSSKGLTAYEYLLGGSAKEERQEIMESRRLCVQWAARQVFEQVSFHHSKHSAMFDVGTLTFSLLVACQGGEIRWGDPIMTEAIRIIFDHQSKDGLWHTTKPLWAKSGRGLSVTSAQLMFGIVELLARCPELQRAYEPRISLYIEWLEKNISTAELASTRLKGWASEVEFSPSRVDIWVTIYVLDLLRRYAGVLNELNREDLVRLSGLSVRRKPRPWKDVRPIDLSLPAPKQLKKRLEQSFVEPWKAKSKTKNCSMVLYGPPGTSKTTIAEGLADALGRATGSEWVYVTVTPGDFIAGGEERAEINAATIFQVLAELTDSVILFDEIDLLLYDREKLSKASSPLQGVLRFMTTSMLTKFQLLRDRGQNIFVVTTNRYEDLDRAVRRAGRFDEHFAVLPPDIVSRQELLAAFLTKFDESQGTHFSKCAEVADVCELAEQACLFTYAELESVVRKALGKTAAGATRQVLKDELMHAIQSYEPATNFAYYAERNEAQGETAQLLNVLTRGEYDRLSQNEKEKCKELAKRISAPPYSDLVPEWLKELLSQES